MERRQAYAIVGTLLFMSGLFRPFHCLAGPYDGTFVLLLASASLLLAWRKAYRGLIAVIAGDLGSLAYTLLTFRSSMADLRAGSPGIEITVLEVLDWAVPLAGVCLLVLAVPARTIRGPSLAMDAGPTVPAEPKPRALPWLLPAVSTLLPLLVIGYYPTIQTTGYETAVYGLSVAMAASFWETGLSKRLLLSSPVAVLGLLLWAAFDVIVIVGVVFAAALLCVGHMPTAVRRRWWSNLLYRLVRMGLSGGAVVLASTLGLPASGQCPGAGGDITRAFVTFAVVTYLPLTTMIAMDGIARSIELRHAT